MSKPPFLLFHWSPVSRRPGILRHGLCPGKLSRSGDWRPPYICFAPSPSLGWGLSARMTKHAGEWDLWMMWSNEVPHGYEKLSTDGTGRTTEYRVYRRIKKRHIWHVGTKVFTPRKREEH